MKFSWLKSIMAKVACKTLVAPSFAMLETQTRQVYEVDATQINFVEGLINAVLNPLINLVYLICKFFLNILDFLQMLCYKIIGLSGGGEFSIESTTDNIIFRFLLSDSVLRAIRAVLVVGIILLIIFTIAALIRSEYNQAVIGDDGHAKTRIFRRTMKAGFAMLLFQGVFLASLIFVNAILASLMSAITPNLNQTVGGTIVAASAYNANNYRLYANANQRIPILINFEDPQMYAIDGASSYTTEELVEIYENWEETGKQIYYNTANNKFNSFGSSLYYKNNVIYNNASYSGFEKFVCTAEQYQVMADFIDYALSNNLKFYIKSTDDSDLDWRFVDDAVFDSLSGALVISYKNSTGEIGSGESYTIVYKDVDFDFNTPIQATLNSIAQILSIGDYSDYQFKMLERVDNTNNIINWKTEKVLLQLSADYKTDPTPTDQLILYEYFRNRPNNTLKNYSIEDFEGYGEGEYLSGGVRDLTVSTISHTRYVPSLTQYVVYKTVDVCYINGSYYRVMKMTGDRDYDGIEDSWYVLDDEILNGITYWESIENSKPSDMTDVVTLKNIGGQTYYVYLETDEYGRASLYNTLRESFNEGAQYSLTYPSAASGDIPYYVDNLEDVYIYGTWAEKIFNDLGVIYKDININTLINTDQWLSAYSKYYDETVTNNQISYTSFNTSLIHPLGLILSELLLGEVNEANPIETLAKYQFSSTYNEQTIKGLFISLLGENEYLSAYQQYQAFMDLFNNIFANVLDEVAYYENLDIVSEDNQSVELYTYKAYLASALLSNVMADYLFETAQTMVSAQDLVYHLFTNVYDSETGTLTGIIFNNYHDYIVNFLKSRTILKSLSDVDKTELESEIRSEYAKFFTTESQAYDKLTADEIEAIIESRTLLYDVYLNESGLSADNDYYLLDLEARINDVIDACGYSAYSLEEIIGLVQNYPTPENIDELMPSELNAFIALTKAVIANSGAIASTDYTKYYMTTKSITTGGGDSVTFAVISNQSAYDLLASQTKHYEELKQTFKTMLVTHDYWHDQLEIYEEDEYDFLDSLDAYLSFDGFGRSWAFDYNSFDSAAGTLSSIKSAVGYFNSTYSDILSFTRGFGFKTDAERVREAYFIARYLTSTSGIDELIAENIGLIKELAEIEGGYDSITSIDEENLTSDDYELIEQFLNSCIITKSHVDSVKQYIHSQQVQNILLLGINFYTIPYKIASNVNWAKLDCAFSYLVDYLVDWNLDGSPDKTNVNSLILQSVDFENGYKYIGQYAELNQTIDELIRQAANLGGSELKELFGKDENQNYYYDLLKSELGYTDDNFNIFYAISTGKRQDASVVYNNNADDSDAIELLKIIWKQMLKISAKGASSNETKQLISRFVQTQQKLDALNLYNIRYAISAYSSQVLNSLLTVKINNRSYSATVGMTGAKFVEYILGYDYLVERNYTPVFIDSSYEGLLSNVTEGNKTTRSTWNELKTFLEKFGQACVDIANKSTLNRLENESRDTFTLDLYAGSEVGAYETYLTDQLGYFLIDNISNTILNYYFEDYAIDETTSKVVIKGYYNTLATENRRAVVVDMLDYLGLSKEVTLKANGYESVTNDFSGFTLSEYKRAAITVLYNYSAIPQETEFENQQRYLTLIHILCTDWETSFDLSRWVKPTESFNANFVNNLNGYYSINNISLLTSSYTLGLIMRMSGLEGRNESELVDLKFTVNLTPNVKSEEGGDVFVICTYDEDLDAYLPFMMTNTDYFKSSATVTADAIIDGEAKTLTYSEYMYQKFGLSRPTTSFTTSLSYVNPSTGEKQQQSWFPVVAKGVVTEEGLPTTIKLENGNIVFYRNDCIIVDVAQLGLSQYFDSTSGIVLRGGYINGIINSFYKATTGKTLTQEIIKTMPRLKIDFDLHFAYGNSYNEVGYFSDSGYYLDYNFSSLDSNIEMTHFYSRPDLNVIALIFGTIFMFSALWTLIWGLIQRVFNILALTITAPAIFATLPLNTEKYDKSSKQYVDNESIFDRWFQSIKSETLSVLGFAVAINIFFILVPIIKSFNLITDVAAFREIPVFKNINIELVNYVMQLVMLVVAIGTIKTAPKLFSGIIGVSVDIMTQGQQTRKVVNEIDKEARDFMSGRSAIKAKDKLIGLVKNNIPGSAIVGRMASNYRMKVAKAEASAASTAAYAAMIANGLTPKDAAKISESLRKTMVQAQRDVENERKRRDNRYYNAAFNEAYYDNEKTRFNNQDEDAIAKERKARGFNRKPTIWRRKKR